MKKNQTIPIESLEFWVIFSEHIHVFSIETMVNPSHHQNDIHLSLFHARNIAGLPQTCSHKKNGVSLGRKTRVLGHFLGTYTWIRTTLKNHEILSGLSCFFFVFNRFSNEFNENIQSVNIAAQQSPVKSRGFDLLIRTNLI